MTSLSEGGMTIRPIIFSAPMVRALLEGRKTQTRRIVNGVPPSPGMDNVYPGNTPKHPAPYLDAYCGGERTSANPRGITENWCYWTRDDRCGPQFKVPYVPGDLLYVRESHAFVGGGDPGILLCQADWRERARELGLQNADDAPRWKPSIHMPRWASRLTLAVTDVRVDRLRHITDKDARAEGFNPDPNVETPWHAFLDYWNKLHGDHASDLNPWVVAVTFTVHKCNVDHFASVRTKGAA